MSTTLKTAQPSIPAVVRMTRHQDHLNSFCASKGLPLPAFRTFSEPRGRRTAWSCSVVIGQFHFDARYFYDGAQMERAQEDAAEVALMRFEQLAPTGSLPTHLPYRHAFKPAAPPQRTHVNYGGPCRC